MLIIKENVLQLIPQRPPIVMVDGLKEHAAESSVSVFNIAPDNIFVADGYFQMPGLIENIAQTVALRAGYEHMLRIQSEAGAAIKPPVGFIGEVKNLLVNFLPPVGAQIETSIDLLHNIFTASVVKGTIMYEGKIAAECEMKVFVQPQTV
jgi:3-hydroxymyristoyl/3-hydroxydecanoyl-(acyl carrier protein) dehydratase